jgi:hypothetical protein
MVPRFGQSVPPISCPIIGEVAPMAGGGGGAKQVDGAEGVRGGSRRTAMANCPSPPFRAGTSH